MSGSSSGIACTLLRCHTGFCKRPLSERQTANILEEFYQAILGKIDLKLQISLVTKSPSCDELTPRGAFWIYAVHLLHVFSTDTFLFKKWFQGSKEGTYNLRPKHLQNWRMRFTIDTWCPPLLWRRRLRQTLTQMSWWLRLLRLEQGVENYVFVVYHDVWNDERL